MPRIPIEGAYADTGSITALNPVRGMTPGEAAIPGQQIQEFGNAMTGLGTEALREATATQEYVNEVQVMDATNRARQRALELTYGSPDGAQSGYTSIKGEAAIKPTADGRSIAEDYTQKFSESIGEISTGLANDAQRQSFALKAQQLQTGFGGDVLSHMHREFSQHALSVADGALRLATDDAKRNWNNPEALAPAIKQVEAATVRAGQAQGWSANQITFARLVATSSAHAGVVEAALQAGNPVYASRYVQQNSKDMTADDLLKAQGLIAKSLNLGIAQQAVSLATQRFSAAIQPMDADRAFEVAIHAESRGRQFGDNGKPLTSRAGAIGIAQVMPDTAPEAAKLAGLPWDENRYRNDPAYNRALGRAYFEKKLQEFGGNLPMAYAAYNAGRGATNAALAKARKAGNPGGWLAYMSEETRGYVSGNMRAYNAGGGTPPRPTEQQFIDEAVGRLGQNAPPELVKLTQDAAQKQFSIISKSREDAANDVMFRVQQALISNGGDFNSLPIQLTAELSAKAPGKFDDAKQFATRVGARDVKSDPELYFTLVTYPDEAAKMSDAQFMQLRTRLSDADFQKFSHARAEIINGLPSATAESINSARVNETMKNRMLSLGIDPTPKPSDLKARERVATIQQYVRDSIFEQQRQTGQKMSPADIDRHIDRLFATDIPFRKVWTFGYETSAPQKMMSMNVSDIPDDSRKQIEAAFAARGVTKPTDDQLLRAYWSVKRNG